MRFLIILLVTILNTSCAFKQEVTNDKANEFTKPPNKSVSYRFENQEKWQELKKVLANDLMSAEELGVIDCRKIKRKSGLYWLTNEKIYSIFNSFYQWQTYQTKNGICIKVLNINAKKESFFITVFDSRVLLSASKAYHFEELGLEKPNILAETIFLGKPTFKYCKTGGTRYFKNKMIYKDNCIIKTLYTFKGRYPDLGYFMNNFFKGDRNTSFLPNYGKNKD